MAKDLRELFEQERNQPQPDLLIGHEDRFLQKLEQQLPQQKERRVALIWLRAAAASVLLISMGWGGYYSWKMSQATVEVGSFAIEHITPVDTAITQKERPTNEQEATKIKISPASPKEKTLLTMSDVSPDLKKVETYFISTIKLELANLEVTAEKKEMVDAYLTKIKELGKEYDHLNEELNTIGVNDMTITALIENLKIRLQLLQRLKKNLNHSKNETHDKNASDNI